jgi:hypothetical protein
MGDRMPWNAKRQDGALISTTVTSDLTRAPAREPARELQLILCSPKQTFTTRFVGAAPHTPRAAMWLGALTHAAWMPRPLRLPEKTSLCGVSTSPWRSATSPSPRHTAPDLAPRTVSHAISLSLSRRDATAAAAAAAFPLALTPRAAAAAAAAPTAGASCDKKTAKRLAATVELLDLAVQASSVQAWSEAAAMAADPLLDAPALRAALDACAAAAAPPRPDERRAVLAGVAELRALLAELGERGGASNAEAMRAMSYGTDARSALDRYLS